jgi:hypothetical protein
LSTDKFHDDLPGAMGERVTPDLKNRPPVKAAA